MIIIGENARIFRNDSINYVVKIESVGVKTGTPEWYVKGYYSNLKGCLSTISDCILNGQVKTDLLMFANFKTFIRNFDFGIEETKPKKDMTCLDYIIKSNGEYGGYSLIKKTISKNGKENLMYLNYPHTLEQALMTILEEIVFDDLCNKELSMEETMELFTKTRNIILNSLK